MQGHSLEPLLRGEEPAEWRQSFYYHYYEFPGAHAVRRHYGVRNQRYKLIHFYKIGEWELYDLERDPKELNSVYGQSDYAAVQQSLHSELLRLRAHYLVPEDVRPVERKSQ